MMLGNSQFYKNENTWVVHGPIGPSFVKISDVSYQKYQLTAVGSFMVEYNDRISRGYYVPVGEMALYIERLRGGSSYVGLSGIIFDAAGGHNEIIPICLFNKTREEAIIKLEGYVRFLDVLYTRSGNDERFHLPFILREKLR